MLSVDIVSLGLSQLSISKTEQITTELTQRTVGRTENTTKEGQIPRKIRGKSYKL